MINKKYSLTPDREHEIDRELGILDSWFCSDHIKKIVIDMRNQIDALRAEVKSAVLEEREACAKIAEQSNPCFNCGEWNEIAQAIREKRKPND